MVVGIGSIIHSCTFFICGHKNLNWKIHLFVKFLHQNLPLCVFPFFDAYALTVHELRNYFVLPTTSGM